MCALAEGGNVDGRDFFHCEVQCTDRFELGDGILFRNMPLRVTGLAARLVRGELVYTYTLATEESLYRPFIPAPLAGKALAGTVLETEGETVKLRLDIDEGREPGRAYPYPFAPITGRAMYAMPIIGTKARLYFPEGREESGFVQDCIRTNGDVCADTADPNTRCFRTEHGKELMMAPGSLHFKDMTAGTGGKLFLELDDAFGIRISSHRNLNISAGGSISISAGGTVRFSAPANIRFSQMPARRGTSGAPSRPEGCFSLENDTHIVAKTTDHRGLSIVSYTPYPNPLTPTANSGAIRMPADIKIEKKGGFNWKGLLAGIAAVAVCVVAAAVSVATFGAGAVLSVALIGAAVGAACAVAGTAMGDLTDGKSGTGAETYFENAIGGAVVGAFAGAIMGPAMKLGAVLKLLSAGAAYGVMNGGMHLLGKMGSIAAESVLWKGSDISKAISGVTDLFDGHMRTNYEYNTQQLQNDTGQLEKSPGNAYVQDTYYLNGQNKGDLSLFKMGHYTADYNGCGWIATYNALSVLDGHGRDEKLGGKDPDDLEKQEKSAEEQIKIAEIIRYYDQNGGTFLNGMWGINPESIAMYFRGCGVKTEFAALPADVDERIKNATVGILEYAHSSGAHYVAVEYDAGDGQYHVYNEYRDSLTDLPYASIDAWAQGEGHTYLALIALEKKAESK